MLGIFLCSKESGVVIPKVVHIVENYKNVFRFGWPKFIPLTCGNRRCFERFPQVENTHNFIHRLWETLWGSRTSNTSYDFPQTYSHPVENIRGRIGYKWGRGTHSYPQVFHILWKVGVFTGSRLRTWWTSLGFPQNRPSLGVESVGNFARGLVAVWRVRGLGGPAWAGWDLVGWLSGERRH